MYNSIQATECCKAKLQIGAIPNPSACWRQFTRMKLQAERPQGQNAITAYGPGFVTINGQTHHSSLIVGHDRLVPDWPVKSIEDLTAKHLAGLDRDCDVILLGTGVKQRFPQREILLAMLRKRIGVEVMDSAAACRTYNILLAEGRAVVAALIIE